LDWRRRQDRKRGGAVGHALSPDVASGLSGSAISGARSIVLKNIDFRFDLVRTITHFGTAARVDRSEAIRS
jgi:hypothetical protein